MLARRPPGRRQPENAASPSSAPPPPFLIERVVVLGKQNAEGKEAVLALRLEKQVLTGLLGGCGVRQGRGGCHHTLGGPGRMGWDDCFRRPLRPGEPFFLTNAPSPIQATEPDKEAKVQGHDSPREQAQPAGQKGRRTGAKRPGFKSELLPGQAE